MPDETVVVEHKDAPTLPLGMEVITPGANMFSDDNWSSVPLVVNPPKAEDGGSEQAKPENPVEEKANEEIVDELEYLERQTGYKTWDEVKALKTEVEQLRSKAQTPAEIKFANEASQKLFEAWKDGKEDDVYSFLDTKRKLAQSANLPAAEAIKLHLQQTNPHYKPEDVEDVFEEKYSIPRKPVQMMGEEQEAFDERMTEYTTRVGKVNRAIERDAVAAKQDLAKRITELVPPEIQNRQSAHQEPDPKVLERFENARNGYLQKMESDYGSFDGFTTKAKDESVELPITFKIDEKDDAEIKQIMQKAVFEKLDVNDYFTNRWFVKEASGAVVPDIKKMKADFMLLEKTEKVLQGIANKSATERRLAQIKINSNINVTGDKTVQADIKKDENAAMLEHFWKKS